MAQVAPEPEPVAVPAPVAEAAPVAESADTAGLPLRVRITKVSDKDAASLLEEMGNLGQVKASERANGVLTVWVDSTCTPDDIEAVCCFIVDADQLSIAREAPPAAADEPAAAAPAVAAAPVAAAPEAAPVAAAPAVAESAAAAEAISQAARTSRAAAAPAHADKESTSIRVGVERSTRSSTWWASWSSPRPCWRRPRRRWIRCCTTACSTAWSSSSATRATCRKPSCPSA